MNIEELKKLKMEIEKQTNSKIDESKYVIVSELNEREFKVNGDFEVDKVNEIENTDKFIADCLRLFEEAVKLFSKEKLNFDQVVISSSRGLLVKKEDFNKFKEMYSGFHTNKELSNYVSNVYVPLKFNVDLCNSGTEEETIDDSIQNVSNDLKMLMNKSVFGIVNFEKFLAKMNELGYSIEFLYNGQCNSMKDYLASINGSDIDILTVRANLGLKKEVRSNFSK